jgi:deoxyribodipyrimidine photo-lyase
MRTLVWFRGKDLRIADHAPLRDALDRGDMIAVFVLQPQYLQRGRADRQAHRVQFLLESLRALAAEFERLGSRLLIARGPSTQAIPRLARTLKVDRVVAERASEPFGRARDERVAAALHVPLELFDGETLHTPETLRTAAGQPFAVFTAFARAFAAHVEVAPPPRAVRRLPPWPGDVRARSVAIPTLASLGIARNPRLQPGGEAEALRRLSAFIAGPLRHYDVERNRLDHAGTSRLSADLKFGTISVRSVWTRVARAFDGTAPNALRAFHNELLWREFAHAMLWDRPQLLRVPFRSEFRGFPWRKDERGWRAWVEGTTGYPVVDAAARQLLGEGFVHNRARMISASFLCKHLMIDFRRGETHFMQFLTDGDWANNDAGWQWSAGCGCDAQPYFRIFNPVTQGTRFDPHGDYVRRWVPELARMPAKYIHAPWKAPPDVLRAAGVGLGTEYPRPIVDHAQARRRFLLCAQEHLGRARAGRAATRKTRR